MVFAVEGDPCRESPVLCDGRRRSLSWTVGPRLTLGTEGTMTDAQPVPNRNTWLVIACSMAAAAVIYGFVIQSLLAGAAPTAAPDPPLPRTFFWGAAAALIVASMLWTQARLRAPLDQATSTQPPGPLLAPADFQVRSIISLALAEAVCVLGFVQAMLYRAPLREYLPFGAAAGLVIVLDIIPIGLRYWSSREA